MRVTLDIEENKFPFFIELINNLSFVKPEIDFIDDLSDAHKKLLSTRIQKSEKNPSRLTLVDDFMNEMDKSL